MRGEVAASLAARELATEPAGRPPDEQWMPPARLEVEGQDLGCVINQMCRAAVALCVSRLMSKVLALARAHLLWHFPILWRGLKGSSTRCEGVLWDPEDPLS
jgi:hypothetical protein